MTPWTRRLRLNPFLAIAAITLLAVSVVAAEPAAASSDRRVFRAGAATSNITPLLGTSLEGVISQNGPATGVRDELHARCLVLDDGRMRVALVICDSTMIIREVMDRAKTLVQEHTGLPAAQILIAATHTHSTPRAMVISGGELERDYLEFLSRRIADGIRRAINHLAPAKIGWASGSKPEWVFNRRWFLTPETRLPNPFGDGTDRVQMNPPRGSPKLAEPAGPVDPEVFVLSVQHADGRPLAVLANYGLHYVGGVGRGQISADYFGAFADRIQELLGADRQDPPFVGIMSNGTSGDVNGINFRLPAPRLAPGEAIRQVAFSLADETLRLCQQIKHHDWVSLVMIESELKVGVRLPSPERVAWAKSVLANARPNQPRSRPEVYAREALALAEYPATVNLKLQALRIGELGIAAAPCEVFAATGLALKEESPLPSTFTISLANGYHGYLPTPRDHELGGYETWPARSSCLEVEAEPKIRAELLRLLESIQPAERQ